MPYQSNKPLATDQLSQSQADILNNFTSLGNFLDSDNATIKFVRQGAAQPTAATAVGLYAKLGSTPAETALFFRRQANGTEIDFTSYLGAANGWCRLPCGIVLKWGAGITGTAISWATNPFAAVYSVTATLNTTGEKHTLSVTGLNINGFSAEAYDMSQHVQAKAFYYIAIGS